jgi:hypothetical protein
MVMDGTCNDECYNEACSFDKGDCKDRYCSADCSPADQLNESCDALCDTAACDYDNGSCKCSEGCDKDLKNNDSCDEACNTKPCYFDNYSCVRPMQGKCNSGCFGYMVGDGTCDEACNVEDCSYDLTDCCSCTDEELGQCKTECLTASCAYDAGCDDDFMKESAKYQQLIKQDFSAQLDFEECYNADSTCTLDDLRAFYAGSGEDLDKCQPLECFSQYGQGKCCPDEMHCTKCIGERCLECAEGYLNYYTTCVETCPLSSTTQSKVPGICFRKRYSAYTDYTIHNYFEAVFLSSPSSLTEVLASTWQASVNILIMFSVVEFSPMSEALKESTSSVSVYSPLDKTYSLSRKFLKIESYVCTVYSNSRCLVDWSEIRVTDRLMTLVVEGFTLILSNVKITGYYAFKSTCADVSCSYCPYLAKDDSFYYDDRHHKYAVKPDWGECDTSDTAFIEIDCQAKLSITNFKLFNFRLNQKAFINAAGSVQISTASFENISSVGDENGFIVQNCKGCDACSFELSQSSVNYFNNGYEIRDSLEQASFLMATYSESVTLSDVSFASSTVHSSDDVPFLYFLELRGAVTIENCSFKCIAVTGPLLSFTYTGNNVQVLELDAANYSIESTTTQVAVKALTVEAVTASAVVKVSMPNRLRNIGLYNISIVSSLALDSLVHLEYQSVPTDTDMHGGTSTTLVGGSRKAYSVRKISSVYHKISITDSYWSNYAFKSSGLVNEELSSVTVANSGRYTGDLRDFTYKPLSDDPEVYLSILPVLDHSVRCEGTLYFDDSYYLTVTNLAFDRVSCSGNTGLEASVQTDITIDTLTSTNALLATNSATAAIFSLKSASKESFTANLAHITVQDMKSEGGGVMTVTGLGLTLKNAVFSRVVSLYYSGIYCDQCSNFIVESSQFSDLTSVSSDGACILSSFKEATVIMIQDCSFNQCKVNKYKAGAISMFFSSLPVTLVFNRLKFSGGSSQQEAAAIYIGSSMILTDESLMSDCSFTGHSDQGASLIELNVVSNLSIKNCHFSDNSHQSSILNINYTLGKNSLSLIDCTFTNNKATNVITVTGKDSSQMFSMQNCFMTNNEASFISVKRTKFIDHSSLFTNGAYGIDISDATSIKLVSTTVSYVTSSDASAIELFDSSILECEGCTFMHNSGGCIRVDSNSRMTVRNSKFSYNTGVIGSVLYLINTKLPNLVQDSEITFNYASSDFTIQSLMSSLTLQRVTLHSNTAHGDPAVSAQTSELSLLNCTLANQTGRSAAFISLLVLSTAVVQDSSISDGQGSAILLVDSDLSLTATRVSNIHSRLSSFMSSTGTSKISIEDCLLNNLTSATAGSFLGVIGGSVEISNTKVTDFNSTAIVVTTGSKFSVKDSVFENGSCPSYSVANLHDISSIEIIDSQFRHNQGSTALSITDSSSSDVTIKGSVFEHNSGGALKLSVKSALVSESVFLNNTSETDGGGISALCARDSCNYTFTHNNFTLNSAKHNGGAINWLSQPSLTNNSFTNNSAAYGPDLASFGVALSSVIQGKEGRLMQESDQSGEVASGQRIPRPYRVELFDHYGNLVKTDNSSTAEVKTPDDKTTSITGKVKVTALNGVYEFSEVVFTAIPGSQVRFEITSDAIKSQESNSSLAVPITFRECIPGEAQIGNSCDVCTAGSYSLDPSQACTDCPQGAVCYGGSLMVPKQGYWRSSKTSDEFMECLVPGACLGSPHIVPSLTGECLRGYRGNLCQACDNGYSRSGADTCAECPSRGGNIAKLLGLICVVCIVSAVMVRSSLMTAYVPTTQHSIYLKIFANYLQLVLLVTQLSLQWPSFVLSFFKAQSLSGSVDQQILSFECYLAGDDPQGDSYKTVYYERLILLAVLPLIISAAVLAFWLTVFYFKRRRSILRKELVATAVVLFFLVHPSLVKEYFAFFSCRQLDGSDLWLTSNLDIKCFDEQHSLYAFSVALPAILIWGVGVPSFILAVLFKKRRSLGTLLMKCRFGFFYNGFKKTHFYWEFLILYRKIFIICLVVFVGNQSISIQALSIMLILLVFLALQFWQQPYSSAALNTMELKAIFVAGITIYCGLYYLAGSTSEGLKVGLFIMIVLVNSYFFYNFLLELLKTLLQILASRFRVFRRFALKEDSFPAISIASANLTSNSSYLNSDNSGKVQTLFLLSGQAEVVPYAELGNLNDFFLKANPLNTLSSQDIKDTTFTSRSSVAPKTHFSFDLD